MKALAAGSCLVLATLPRAGGESSSLSYLERCSRCGMLLGVSAGMVTCSGCGTAERAMSDSCLEVSTAGKNCLAVS